MVVAPDEAGLDAAVRALRAGLVIAMPTDTVYGVAVDPFVDGATQRLFDAKRRPRDVALPVLVADVEQLDVLCEGVPPVARRLIDAYWPGALTIVLTRRSDVGLDLGTVEDTVGVRCPDHPVARELCRRVGPLATTSANLHRDPTPPDAAGVEAALGDGVAVVIDGGECAGAPSTVVDCTGGDVRLLRAGRLPWEAIAATLGELAVDHEEHERR